MQSFHIGRAVIGCFHRNEQIPKFCPIGEVARELTQVYPRKLLSGWSDTLSSGGSSRERSRRRKRPRTRITIRDCKQVFLLCCVIQISPKVFVLVVLWTAKRAKMSMILSEFVPVLLERVDASGGKAWEKFPETNFFKLTTDLAMFSESSAWRAIAWSKDIIVARGEWPMRDQNSRESFCEKKLFRVNRRDKRRL